MSQTRLKIGIQAKLLITMTGLIVCLLATMALIQISVQKGILESEYGKRSFLKKEILKQRATTLTENLGGQVQNELAVFNLSNLSYVIQQVVDSDPELAYGILMDSGGKAYVHTANPLLVGKKLTDNQSFGAFSTGEPTIQHFNEKDHLFIEFDWPIIISTDTWGKLRLGFSLHLVNQELLESRNEISNNNKIMIRRSLLTSIFFVTTGALIVHYICSKISTPLAKLTESVIELEKGNFSQAARMKIHSNDEVGLLSSAFTRMSNRLKESYEQLEHSNRTLEDKVKKRTEELSKTLAELKEAQSQLVQSEKMASMGTLVAGVAHEINNPVNFVNNGARNIRRRLEELRTFTFQLMGEKANLRIREAFNERFDPLFENLGSVLNGTERIKAIVLDLRSFSRLEEAEKKRVEILECLESTINLVKTNFNGEVEFAQDFQANPSIECWPAQLNQVFMNLIMNGCQAILSNNGKDSEADSAGGRIRLTTLVRDSSLVIGIEDNGCGIPDAIQDKIYEPFFTTKTVGEGTGLGLSISFGIVEKHSGKIKVKSKQGVGTKFEISLPLSSEELVSIGKPC